MKIYAIVLLVLQVLPVYGSLEVNIERKKCRRAKTFSFDDYVWAESEWRRRRQEWKRDQVVTLDKPWARDSMDDLISKLIKETAPEVKKTDE